MEYNISTIGLFAERENNSKRKNLLVNKYQAKHIPSSPDDFFNMCNQLADKIDRHDIPVDNILVIGFAETATAIGMAVAARLGNVKYMHTSREPEYIKYKLLDFSEEHSHATEQNLFSKTGLEIFNDIKLIVFVEDELTTGKTILNFVNALSDKTETEFDFCVASLINGMSDENMAVFSDNKIQTVYLIKTDNIEINMNESLSVDFKSDEIMNKHTVTVYDKTLHGYPDPRLCVSAALYNKFCSDIANTISVSSSDETLSIDVIGTEECMYPAIKLAEKLQNHGHIVTCHSTTRSPIRPSDDSNYPLHTRYQLHSFYEAERTTFIYNMQACDMTILVTDSLLTDDAIVEFANVIQSPILQIIRLERT